MNFNIVYPFFILIVALLTGCNDYKEEFSKVEGLTVERDELVLTSGSGKEKTEYNFNIKENSDLATAMLQHKDTVIVLRNVLKHTFVASYEKRLEFAENLIKKLEQSINL